MDTDWVNNTEGGADRDNSYEAIRNFPDGSLSLNKIESKDTSGVASIPLLTADGTAVFITADGSFIRMGKKNNIVRERKNAVSEKIMSPLCADEKGNIYFITLSNKLYSYDKDFKKNWERSLPVTSGREIFSGPLFHKGVVAGISNGTVVKYSEKGKMLWSRSSTYSPVGIAAEGNTLAISLSAETFGATDTLLLLDGSGNIQNGIALGGHRLFRHPVIKNGKIYAAGLVKNENDMRSSYFCFDTKGRKIFEKKVGKVIRNYSVSHDGSSFISMYDNGIGFARTGIMCISPEGKSLWGLYFDYDIQSAPLIAEKTIAVLGNSEETAGVFYVDRKKGALLKSISIGDGAPFIDTPLITSDGKISYFSARMFYKTDIEKNFVDKLLPF